MNLKILYSPIPHGVLEYDDLRMLTSEGHRVFSLGQYGDFDHPVEGARPTRPEFYQKELTEIFKSDPNCSYKTKKVSLEFVNNFDVVIASGVEQWVLENFSSLTKVPIVFRTIGQSNAASEALISSTNIYTKIVRYASSEVGLPGFARTDEVIYFGKSLEEYPNWRGGGNPLTFHSNYKDRDTESSPSILQYESLSDGTYAELYGVNSDDTPRYKGIVHFSKQFEMMADASCYLYVWSRPPSYTLSLVEAMLVGLPIVAPSRAFVSSMTPRDGSGWFPERYEVQTLLSDGCGLLYNTLLEGRNFIAQLQQDKKLATEISQNSRLRSREIFDDQKIGRQWTRFLNKTVFDFKKKASANSNYFLRLRYIISSFISK